MEKERNMGKNKSIAINIAAQLISFAMNLGISFILTPYVTNKLGKDVYGFVGMAYQVTSYISMITTSLNSMLNIFVATRYHKGDYKKANEYYASVVIADIALALMLMLPLLFITIYMDSFLSVPASSLQDIKLLWGLIFASFLIGLSCGPFGIGVFLKNRLDLSAKRNMESNILKAIILFTCFCLFLPKVWYVGFATFVCAIYTNVTNYFYVKKLAPELKLRGNKFSFQAVKELLLTGIWSSINQLTNILLTGLDLIVSNMWIGSLAMGYISYAQTFPTQMTHLLSLVSGSFMPQLTKTFVTGDTDDFVHEVKSSVKVCGFLCSVPQLGIIAFGISFYHLWITALTSSEVITVNILSWMILAPTFITVYTYPLSMIPTITRKVRLPVIISLTAGVVNIVFELILLMTTDLGVYAIEIATLVVLVLRAVCFTPIYAAHLLKVKWYTFYPTILRGVMSSAVVLTIFVIIQRVTQPDNWITFFVVVAIAGSTGYIINYFTLLNSYDRQKVKTLVMKKLKKKQQ